MDRTNRFFSFKTRASLINVSARDVMSAGRRGCGNCVYTHAVASRRLRGNVMRWGLTTCQECDDIESLDMLAGTLCHARARGD